MLKREAMARVLPFAIYMGFILVADVLSRLGVTDVQLRWLYAVKIGAVVAALLFYRREYRELASRLSPRAALVAVAAGVLVLVLWINLDLPWMRVGASAGFDPRTDGVVDWSLVAVRLLGAALVVPLMEELFWRSFLLRWVQSPDFLNVTPAQVKVGAFVVTVILFGIEHNLWLAGMVAGLVYNLLYIRSSTLWSPILAHAVTNGLLGLWIIQTANWTYW
ncbi:MAG: CAAX prenyl protease-related protein [Pseudomonadota bacterium]|jgi:CAAX prenyl protease-like protein